MMIYIFVITVNYFVEKSLLPYELNCKNQYM